MTLVTDETPSTIQQELRPKETLRYVSNTREQGKSYLVRRFLPIQKETYHLGVDRGSP